MIRKIISFILFLLLAGTPLALRAGGTDIKTGENFSCPFVLGTFSSGFNTSHKVNDLSDYDIDYPVPGEDHTFYHDVVHQFTITQPMEFTYDHYGTTMEYQNSFYTALMSSSTHIIPEIDFAPSSRGEFGQHRYELAPGTYYIYTRANFYFAAPTTINLVGRAFLPGEHFLQPIDAGRHSADFSYTDSRDTRGYVRSNFYNKPGKEVVYKLTLPTLMRLDIDNFGSNVEDTYLSVYSADKKHLYSNDNHSQGGANPYIAELNVPSLHPGTYYIVVDGNVDGTIRTNIRGYVLGVEGDRQVTAIDAGSHEGGFLYSDMRDTSHGFTNQFGGKPTNDVFYRVTLKNSADLQVSHCGSVVADTYLSVLNSVGVVLYSNDNYTGPEQCGSSGNAFLKLSNLPAGTYYIVSEGNSQNGLITTTIESREAVGNLTTTVGQPHAISYIPTVASDNLLSAGTGSVRHEIQYYDYFGNATVKVQRGFSPYGSDLYTLQEYDGIGRESNLWLPVVKSKTRGSYILPGLLMDAARQFSPYGTDANPYSRPVYDGSPLNQISEQYSPGEAWHTGSHSVKTDRMTNLSPADASTIYAPEVKLPRFVVKHYQVSGNTLTDKGAYATGTLDVTTTTDEDGNVSYRFTDHNDRTVLTRQMAEGEQMHDTYTLYDGYGNIHLVLPPMAVDGLAASSATTWTEDNTILKKYAYIYHYDKYNRCVYKKLPGCEPIYTVYDAADRAIFTQDGNQRDKGEWSFSVPDAFNRVVLTGTCKNTMDYTSTPLGNLVVKAIRMREDNTLKGYTVPEMDLNTPTVLSANYYDTYDFLGFNGILNNATTAYTEVAGYGKRSPKGCKGQLTGTWTASLSGNSGTTQPVYTVMYYDGRYRLIQQKGNNPLNGTEQVYTAYNFEGSPTEEKHVRTVPGQATLTEIRQNTYDLANRLLKTVYRLDDNAPIILVDNVYDEIGRLKADKRNGHPNLRTAYDYNIRSWTKKVNGPLFSQTLNYQESIEGNTPCYNGSISSMLWQSGNEGNAKGYHFTYDGLSRLKNAIYGEGNGLANNISRFNEQITGYDKMGNILSLLRYGQTGTSAYGLIDNLNLTYNGNQLQAVNDAATNSVFGNGMEFKDGAKQTIEYTYDKNGNQTKDLNKNITSIQYNLLNLPSQVSFAGGNRIEYMYDANGIKLRTVHVINGTTTIIDYCGNAVYENGELKTLLNEAGYVSFLDKKFHFSLKDHQGNVRVVADKDGNVEEANAYYPFGGTFTSTANVQPYKYNGKELDTKNGLNWYDYGARHYDAAIGRWCAVDPMSETCYNRNPYHYCENNPARLIDSDGMQADDPIKAIVNLPEVTIIGQKVMKPVSGFWDNIGYYLFGRTLTLPVYGINNGTQTSNPIHYITYDINKDGIATRVTPMGGIAPSPSATALNIKDVAKLLKAGKEAAKAGLTAVGRGLQKHGSRAGSAFPKAIGNQAAINQQGETILKSILENPSVTATVTKSRSVGEVLDYKIPGGIGARFSPDGKTFIGFLEP